MSRIVVAILDLEDARDALKELPGLVNEALRWEAYLAGRNPLRDRTTTPNRSGSTNTAAAPRYLLEWAQHAASLLHASSDRQFDIAVLTDDDRQYERLACQTDIFGYGLLGGADLHDDWIMGIITDDRCLDINFTITPPGFAGGKEGDLSAEEELGSGLIFHACLLTTNEWEHM